MEKEYDLLFETMKIRIKDFESLKQMEIDDKIVSEKIIDELQDEVSTMKVKLRSSVADKERLTIVETENKAHDSKIET